jgi:phosphodiesterase/alkaline phosphatase D-like protein
MFPLWVFTQVQRFLAVTPMYTAMDDHEIVNDWGAHTGQDGNSSLYQV